MISRRTLITAMRGGVLAAALCGGGPGLALAQPTSADTADYDGQPVADLPVLAPWASLPELTNAGPIGGPVPLHTGHECYGQTDQPHNSTHYPGYVLVSSRTVCGNHTNTVEVKLYRKVFGVLQFLDRGYTPATGTAQANARWECPSGSYLYFYATGHHTSGGHSTKDTSNEATVTCN